MIKFKKNTNKQKYTSLHTQISYKRKTRNHNIDTYRIHKGKADNKQTIKEKQNTIRQTPAKETMEFLLFQPSRSWYVASSQI